MAHTLQTDFNDATHTEQLYSGVQTDDAGIPTDDIAESDSDNDHEDTNVKQQKARLAVDDFLKTYGLSPGSTPPEVSHLAYPIIIPQRRPGNKERGFVKAYAPTLEQYSINQDAFIKFINLMNKAVKQNKWLVAIQLAAAGTSLVPNNIAMGVSVAVQVIAGAVAQAEAKWRTNSFLDRINNEFFRPRGLFCLLMAYNPVALDAKATVSDPDAISNSIGSFPSSSPTAKVKISERVRKNLRNPVAGTTKGADQLPRTKADLIYEGDVGKSKSPDTTEKKKLHVNKYLDRRAQARYAKESNGDILSNPNTGAFNNRYLDPNSPANNGGLLGLLSGGLLTQHYEKTMQNMRSQYATQMQAAQEQQEALMDGVQQQFDDMGMSMEQQREYMEQYHQVYELRRHQMQQQSELLEKGQLQRRITRDILYLMIVNMPSELEMTTARQQVRIDGQVHTTSDVDFLAVDV